MNTYNKELDFLLPHQFRKIGKYCCLLGVPFLLLFLSLGVFAFDLKLNFWDEWGLYLIHLPLSLGLYCMLFAKEKREDEFFMSLRLRSISQGVILVVGGMAMLPVFTSIYSLVFTQSLSLPDVGGNLAVCTLLLFYANFVYGYQKYLMEKNNDQ